MASEQNRTGIYCRISRDPDGTELGVKRQEKDCRALCAERGWSVIDVYVDDDRSAFSGKPRPEYERLLVDVESGKIDRIVAWHPDRLHRRPIELENFITLVEAKGTQVDTVQTGAVDLSTSNGRVIARVVGAIATGESEHKSERIKRKHLELAEAGKLGGGGRRPFGFENDRVTINEVEAELVREAAQRVLSGESLYSIRQDWTAREIETSTGATWSTTAIKSLLTNPRIAGLRRHNGKIMGKAVWGPVLDEVTWRRVCSVLSKRSKGRERPARSYLLTGLVKCAVCDSTLDATPRSIGPRPYRKTLSSKDADLVRSAANRFLAGDALSDIASDWTDAGIKNSAGFEWSARTIQKLLRDPWIAGLPRNVSGESVAPEWPKLIASKQWKAIDAKLAGDRGERAYGCRKEVGGCGSVHVLAEPLEELIVEAVLIAVDGDELAQRVHEVENPADHTTEAEVLRAESDLEELARMFGDGDITAAEWKVARSGAESRLDEARGRLTVGVENQTLVRLAGSGFDLGRRWGEMLFGEKRAVLEAVVEAVTVDRVGSGGGKRFRPERVGITWR